MVNEVKLQEGHPVDENIRPIKVGGKSTAIETAQHGNGARVNGDLEVTGDITGNIKDMVLEDVTLDSLTTNNITSHNLTIDNSGDITLDAEGGEIHLKDDGAEFGRFTTDSSKSSLLLYEQAGATDDDYFKIEVATHGITTIKTVNAVGTVADLVIDVAGDITLDAANGNFIAKKAGTEFSVANSAWAGMILGYRCIGEDATPATFTLTTSMVTIHSDATVRFIAPPSGNVEVNFQAHYYGGNGATVTLGISDNATYSALSAPSAQYEKVSFDVSRFDDAILNQNWVITSLNSGDTYNYWIGAKTSSTSGTPTIKYGGDSAGENVPLIIKVTALPTAVSDFAVYG